MHRIGADYTTDYTFITLAGMAGNSGTNDGTGNAARFCYPFGVAVDSKGNLYVADKENSTIRKVTPEGEVTTMAGLASSPGTNDGLGSTARFSYPSGVAVDKTGNVYVADSGNNTIRKITPEGQVTTLAGRAGAYGDADGTGDIARFDGPWDLAVDESGNIYVVDSANFTIRKVTAAGVVTTLAGKAGEDGNADGIGSTARFDAPSGVALDSAGTVYVADSWNNTIRKIDPAIGVVSTLAGLGGFTNYGSADGIGNGARFFNPSNAALDSAGNVYVTDGSNFTIRKITPAGMVTTLGGKVGSRGTNDGIGIVARFDHPCGVAVDSAGNIYVADAWNHAIRKGHR
jgi:sugar lactone lactonase YvrE